MSYPVSKSELARMGRISPAGVGKLSRPGGKLHPALRPDGRIDAHHECVVAWLGSKGVAPPGLARGERKGASAKPAPRPRPVDPEAASASPVARRQQHGDPDKLEDIDGWEDLTLRELTDRFGTVTGLKDWLDARKKLADIREKDLKNSETEGRLIPRDGVRAHVIGAIDGVFRRLLQDAPKTISRRACGMHSAGESAESIEGMVRETIGSQLRPVRDQTVKALRNL